MKRRKEQLPLLILGIVSFICVGLTFYFVDPEKSFYGVSPIFIFFLFIFLSIFGIASFLSINVIRGILISFFVTSLLVLQMTGFANLLYVFILLLIVIVLDMGLKKK